MKNIYVVRPVGFNVGNQVIFAGLKRLVRDHFGNEVNFVSVPATSKYDSFGRPGLSSASIFEMNQYADGVIVGGGNLLENGELDIDPVALSALTPPLMIFSVSWGRIFGYEGVLTARTDSLPDSLSELLLAKAKVVVARDFTTREYMEDRSAGEVLLGGCPSLLLNSVMADRKQKNESHSVGNLISLRHPALMSISPRNQSRVRHHIRTLIDYFRSLDEPVTLLCHDHRDLAFASSFSDVSYLYEEDLFDFLHLIHSATRLVTYRLHSFIPAIVFGTHAINISYDERASSAIDTLGLGACNVSMFGGRPVMESVIELLENTQTYLNSVHASASIRNNLIEVQRLGMARFYNEVMKYNSRKSR